MTERFATPKDRIAQAIYVIGGIAAVFYAGLGVAVLALEQEFGPALGGLAMAVGCYAVGWGLRWIINGTSSSVLDYLRRV